MILKPTKLHQDQQGMVAIIITMILISLLTLVTLGFSRLMLREQRQALDRQLSTQAFYAAESGVNDAIASGSFDKTNCDPFPAYDKNLSAAAGVSYSCVLIEDADGELEFNPVSVSDSTMFPVNSASVNRLTFNWTNPTGANNYTATGNYPYLPNLANWGTTTGVLRISIYPADTAGMTRAGLAAAARTYFLYPNNTVPAQDITYGTTPNGQLVPGDCNAAGCSVDITNLSSARANKFYVRIKAIYNPVALSVTGVDGSGGSIAFTGAQFKVDATGRSNDILRRVQVRIPVASNYDWPEYVVDSGDTICKLLRVGPSGSTNDCIF